MHSRETKFGVVEEKDPFLVFDDVKKLEKKFLYLHKEKFFLKYLPNATYEIRDAQKEFPNTNPDRIEKNVYEVLNHNATAGVTKNGFLKIQDSLIHQKAKFYQKWADE